LNAALEGDFSAIDDGLTAITVVRSIKRTMAQQKHSLTLNLLGIYNFVHVSTLIAEGTVLVEPQTGSLIITDKASATRVQASSSTVEADPEKLRTLYADSFMITAAYRGSRNTVGDPALTSAHLFFENHKNTNRQAMKDMLQIAIAMGLLSDTDAAHDLDDLDDFGASSTFAENRYDETLCKMLFLRGAQSRAQAEYETAGRAAILRLVAPGDPDEFRRIPALRDDVWNQLRTIGNVAVFSQVLAGLNSVQVSTIGADYLTIIWWAQSMSAMAQVVAQCEAFFAANPSADVNDHQFTALRQKLAKQISNVVANTRSEFGRPWGLIAMDQILSPRSKARVQISSKAFSFSGERQVSK
jgi:hypothetical protein